MDAALAIARILVGALMVMTGVMKLLVPHLREAFSGLRVPKTRHSRSEGARLAP